MGDECKTDVILVYGTSEMRRIGAIIIVFRHELKAIGYENFIWSAYFNIIGDTSCILWTSAFPDSPQWPP